MLPAGNAKAIVSEPTLSLAARITSRSESPVPSPRPPSSSSSSVVTVKVVGFAAAASYAPMSTVLPARRGYPAPRWSVNNGAPAGPTARKLDPASIAGLPPSKACVCVGPPLSASGPKRGSAE